MFLTVHCELYERKTSEPQEEGKPGPALHRVRGPRTRTGAAYLAVGITNSAPLPMLSGQRCMTDFCFV
ncbi:hypothetical protein SAMN05444746_104182 [Variovorax sp. OK212]|nr:hypothetical protein SAMN05518853_104182 [Variovorax sp. OK202]SFD03982.1 hypothetical protein SAMN05444746_104182 [Variovorax sp. OK212]